MKNGRFDQRNILLSQIPSPFAVFLNEREYEALRIIGMLREAEAAKKKKKKNSSPQDLPPPGASQIITSNSVFVDCSTTTPVILNCIEIISPRDNQTKSVWLAEMKGMRCVLNEMLGDRSG